MIHNDIIHSWKLFLYVLEHIFLYRWWPSDVDCSLIGWHKMSVTPELVNCCQVWCLYEIGMRIPFSKQYRYVTNHLHLYITKYYIFVFALTLLLLTVFLSLVNMITSSNTFTAIVKYHQINTSPIFYRMKCSKLKNFSRRGCTIL